MVGGERYVIVVLFGASLGIYGQKHLFICLVATRVSSLEKQLFRAVAPLKIMFWRSPVAQQVKEPVLSS